MAKGKKNAGRADDCIPQLFIGRFDSKVYYSKVYYGGRICIPTEWRFRIDGDRVVALRNVAEQNAFCLMPESEYEMELTAMQDKECPEEQRAAILAAKRLCLDVRSRIKLPDELLRLVGGGGRVTLWGCIRKIRVCPYIEPPVVDGDALAAALEEALGK